MEKKMRIIDIFLFELKSSFKKVSTYLYFCLFIIIGYMAIFTALLGGGPLKNFLNAGVGNVQANAPYVLYYLITMMSNVGILITAATFGNTACKDFRKNTHELYFSYPIKKIEYLAGRFAAALFSLFFIFSGTGIGAAIANILPFVSAEKLGPLDISSIFQPYMIGVVPNLLFMGALFFSIALLSRKVFSAYLGSFALFMGYLIGLSLLQSRSPFLASLFDPFSQIAVRNLYGFWTIAQKNSLLIPLNGYFLINRAVWIALAISLLIYAYKKFQFSYQIETKRQKTRKTEIRGGIKREDKIQNFLSAPVVQPVFEFRSHIKQMLFTTVHDFKSLVKNISFLIILSLGALFMLLVGFRNVGLIRGTQTYPATHQVLESLGDLFMFFLFILIAFCAGELVWRERNKKFNKIYDALPTPPWVPLLGKLGALFLIQILLMLVLMLGGILIQILHGYFRFDFAVYIQDLFGMRLITFLLMAVMALFLQIAVNSKLLGYVLFTLFLILQDAVHMMGLEHYLFGYADLLTHTYSEMSGYGPYAGRLFAFNLYYSAIAFLLILLSSLLWVRGMDTKFKDRLIEMKERSTKNIKITLGTGISAALLIAAFIVYNTNVLNRYDSTRRVTQFRVRYEKKFHVYADMPLPQIIDMKMEVDIYPQQKKVKSRGQMILENRDKNAIEEIFVQFSRDVRINRLEFQSPFHLKEAHPDDGVYIYRFEKPMAPGEKTILFYDQEISVRGFQNHDRGDVLPWIRTRLLKNGTFLYPFDTAPILCYDLYSYYELSDIDKRRRHELSPKERIASQKSEKARMKNPLGTDADWINFEAIVSTSQDQIALSSGELIKEWKDGDRRYFQYRAENTILKYFPFLSARYSLKKASWQDVDIEIYHHPDHDTNIDMMIKSITMSLDYFTKNFSPYQFKEIRIVEFPKYRIMAEGFPSIIPISEGYGFMAKFDGSKVAYVFRATAHEVAHQWWAHQVIGADVEGVFFLIESMAQYSALMVTKREYAQPIINDYMQDRIDAYMRGRARETRAEAPLALSNRDVAYVNYDKGIVVMNALQDYVGEEFLNAVIKSYIKEKAFQSPPFTTSAEFISALRPVTPEHLQYIITDWLETITVNDNRGVQATREKQTDGRYLVKFQFEAKKYRADEQGKEQPAPLNDFIPFGVYDTGGKQIYLKKHLVDSETTELEFLVSGFPETVGIDPHFLLIDKNTGDNVIEIRDHK
jgi:ABC-2 type transport system permease protein